MKWLEYLKNNDSKYVYIFLFVIGFVFLLFFSTSTSPLYPDSVLGNVDCDSMIFQTVGREWANGKMPYTEVFDHKGPYIFFVDMLGYKLGSRYWIFAIQVIHIFFALAAVYKTAALAKTHKIPYGLAASIAFLAILSLTFYDGNLTEEYCLPFLAFSQYFQLKYFIERDENGKLGEHKPQYAFFYGLCFSIAILTRMTNAAPALCGTAVIAVILIIRRKYRNLLLNAAGFILGTIIPIVPFAIYFAANNAFNEFIYGMLIFNFKYNSAAQSWVANVRIATIIIYLGSAVGISLVFIGGLLFLMNKKYAESIYCAFCLAAYLYLCFAGKPYLHYAMISAVQTGLLCYALSECRTGVIKRVFLAVFGCMCVKYVYNYVYNMVSNNIERYDYHVNTTSVYEYYYPLVEQIPPTERDSVNFYGGIMTAYGYIMTGTSSPYKYYFLQDSQSSCSEEYRAELYDIYENGNCKWIITNPSENFFFMIGQNDEHTIDDILEERYSLYSQNGVFCLYRLNE